MTGRRTTDNQAQSDHDLLLSFRGEITTKMDYVIQGMDKLSNTVTTDVNSLKQDKLDKDEFEKWRREELEPGVTDREARIRRLESWGYTAIGALGFLQVVSLLLGIYSFFHFTK